MVSLYSITRSPCYVSHLRSLLIAVPSRCMSSPISPNSKFACFRDSGYQMQNKVLQYTAWLCLGKSTNSIVLMAFSCVSITETTSNEAQHSISWIGPTKAVSKVTQQQRLQTVVQKASCMTALNRPAAASKTIQTGSPVKSTFSHRVWLSSSLQFHFSAMRSLCNSGHSIGFTRYAVFLSARIICPSLSFLCTKLHEQNLEQLAKSIFAEILRQVVRQMQLLHDVWNTARLQSKSSMPGD